MNVAALELCKELYGLSGWGTTDFYHYDLGKNISKVVPFEEVKKQWRRNLPTPFADPAYDLGYLLRKLLPWFKYDGHSSVYLYLSPATDGETWFAGYSMPNGNTPNHPGKSYEYDIVANTPEDAACKLTIELFKQKVLTKEIQSS